MIIHTFEQQSEEWCNIRLGKLTGSDFHTLLGDSETKKTLLYKKAAERLTNTSSDSDKFSNIHTVRGKELEDEARMTYELETGANVEQVGFVELNKFVGCSPDGLLPEGGIEIKCKDNHGFLKAVVENYIEPAHRTQMQFNMYVCERKWWDYSLYNPNFSNPLRIIRVLRDDVFIEKIKLHIDSCNAKISEIMSKC